MMNLNVYEYIALVCAALMVILILIQTRGASLGAGLGGAGEVNTQRRGTERTIFRMTIFLAVVFSLALIFSAIG